MYSLSVQRGRIEYEGETSVYTQISPLKIRGKDEYILIFPGEKLVYTNLSGGEMSRGENEYVTPVTIIARNDSNSYAYQEPEHVIFYVMLGTGLPMSMHGRNHIEANEANASYRN